MKKYDLNKLSPETECRHTTCCGMVELFHLDDGPEAALAVLWAWMNGMGYDEDGGMGNIKPLCIFTDNCTRGYGRRLAQYIRQHRLGRVSCSGKQTYNPNSGNYVQGWIWRIDFSRFELWCKSHVILPQEN